MNAPAHLDPAIVEFVKALARANAARDIATLRRSRDDHAITAEQTSRAAAR